MLQNGGMDHTWVRISEIIGRIWWCLPSSQDIEVELEVEGHAGLYEDILAQKSKNNNNKA